MRKLILILLLMLISFASYAGSDGRPMMRQMYARIWSATIMNMFSSAGPTTVRLMNTTLVIYNPHCNEPEVKTVLRETFAPAKAKMGEIGITYQCVSNTLAMNT